MAAKKNGQELSDKIEEILEEYGCDAFIGVIDRRTKGKDITIANARWNKKTCLTLFGLMVQVLLMDEDNTITEEDLVEYIRGEVKARAQETYPESTCFVQ